MCNNAENYINHTIRTINELRTIGEYYNDIVLIYDNELVNMLENEISNLFKDELTKLNVILQFFPTIDRTSFTEMFKNNPFTKGDKREITKTFQYHKFYVFHEYFKNWDKIFYIDAGMHILKPIKKILDIECDNNLLAHSDSYPYYKNKLDCQFEQIAFPDVYNDLKKNFNLKIDFFQSTILLFNSSIINSNTLNDLIELSNKYFISSTNEQGIMNLLFNCKLGIWKQIQLRDDNTFFYDFWERPNYSKNNYIMLKRIRFNR